MRRLAGHRLVGCSNKIRSEDARFESLVSQLKAHQDRELQPLKAQLRLANKLLDFTVWHDRLRADLSARIAVAEAVENLIKQKTR